MQYKQFKAMTDEEVVASVHAGNSEGMEYLLDKYKSMVRQKARTLYLIGGEGDDLIQEGMIGLFKAVQSFDKEKDASFYSFAQLCVSRQLYTAVKASQRKKHSPLNSYISLESVADGEDGPNKTDHMLATDSSPEELLINRESKNLLEKKIMENLSSFERQVIKLYLDGIGYVQIAEILNKEEKSVDNALQRIKTKIRNLC